MAEYPRRRLLILHLSLLAALAQDLSSLPTAAQEQIRRQLEQRKQQRREQQNANKNPWGKTVQKLAAKWGDEKGTIQKYGRDFRVILKLHEIDNYMSIIHKPGENFYAPIWDRCNLKYEHCAEMASKGLCLSPPSAVGFMNRECAPACATCHLMSYETRCPFDEDDIGPAAIREGELNHFFDIITQNKLLQEQYGPMTIHSMPGGADSGGPDDGPIISGPWIVTFENFLTEYECHKLIEKGKAHGHGFSASKIRQHELDPTFNASEVRTSTTNWCREECYHDPDVDNIHTRIETLTGNYFPRNNFEDMQLLRYQTGQHYSTHSDFIPVHLKRPYGPRVLTVFLYLNNVEEGGGTNFPNIGDSGGITIQPKMGKVVIWSSVLDSDPLKIDERTRHGALPVEKGLKFGANVWIHLRDFKTAEKNCKYEDPNLSTS